MMVVVMMVLMMMVMKVMLMMVMKVIGRNLLGAVDVGDCIFSHMFGAYFGLSISKVLHFHLSQHKWYGIENSFVRTIYSSI